MNFEHSDFHHQVALRVGLEVCQAGLQCYISNIVNNNILSTLATITLQLCQYWQNCQHRCRKYSITWIVEPIDRRYRNGAHRGQTSDCDGDDGGDSYKDADDDGDDVEC